MSLAKVKLIELEAGFIEKKHGPALQLVPACEFCNTKGSSTAVSLARLSPARLDAARVLHLSAFLFNEKH